MTQILITTTGAVPGHRVLETFGLVRGASIRTRHLFLDIVEFLRNLAGAELTHYVKMLAETQPLGALAGDQFVLVTTELFGPFQVVVEYADSDLPVLLDVLERISHHLTAGVVSNDTLFLTKVLGASVNGTTYCGMRGRTTGAPQNHWFGPSGDPRAAGIGTPEAIIATWSGHREIVSDQGPLPDNWATPPPT